eukprot:91145-Chlamydomonas_euryale.AAC.3
MSSAVLLEIKLLKERLHALEALVERERGSSDASASASGAGVTAPGPHAQPHSHGELHAAAVHTHAPVRPPLHVTNGACASAYTYADESATHMQQMAHAQAHAPVRAPLAYNEWRKRMRW